MATNKEYLDYLIEQLSLLEEINYKSMMGEYILYYKDKLIAYVCDNRLLVKTTPNALKILKGAPLEKPYDGAKDMIVVTNTDNMEFLYYLFTNIYEELPFKTRKK